MGAPGSSTAMPPQGEAPHFDIVSLGEPMVEFNQTGAQEGRAYLQGFGALASS